MHNIIHNLTVIVRNGIQHPTKQFAALGITACQSPYLVEICANPGISQECLARKLSLNKSNVTRQVAILEEAGFLYRTLSPTDKRMAEVYPTQKAYDALPHIWSITADWENFLTQDLTEEETKLLAALLEKMSSRTKDNVESQ